MSIKKKKKKKKKNVLQIQRKKNVANIYENKLIYKRQKKIKYLFSTTSSTVADPSTVTVRIESASTSDLNVQDVVTTSSSSSDDDDLHQQKNNYHTLSTK